MSNYVYNDSFTEISPDNEPEKKESGILNKKLIIIGIASLVVAMILGCLLGALISGLMNKDKGNFVNTVPVSAPTDKLAQKGDFTLADVIDDVKSSVVEIQTEYIVHSHFNAIKSGAGSGVIIGTHSKDDKVIGYNIITNAHVIQGGNASTVASRIRIILNDGSQYNAEIVGVDTFSDIAVLRIKEDKRELTCATLATANSVRVGDGVFAIGNPLGELGGSVTTGIISALDREIEIDGGKMTLLQTDASINPGNSGGGLFDMSGRLVGIVNAKSYGTGIEGLGFAIPAQDASKVYSDIVRDGFVRGRPHIGVVFAEYFDGTIRVYMLENGYNEDALNVGDKITSIDGVEITSASQISEIVREHKIGDKLTFVINRNKEEKTLIVEVFEHNPTK